jgi:hypothetical protein
MASRTLLDDLDLLDVALLDPETLSPIWRRPRRDLAGLGVDDRPDRPHLRRQLVGRDGLGRVEQPRMISSVVPYSGPSPAGKTVAGILLDWSMRIARMSFWVTLISIQLPRSGI